MPLSSFQAEARIETVDGKQKLVLEDEHAYRESIWRMKPGPKIISIEDRKDRRSHVANRYHWGVVIKMVAGETGQDEDSIHYDFYDRFLRRRIHYTDAMGHTVEREFAVGSSGLTVKEFYEFVEKCRLFAAEFFGLRIPDPDPEYRRLRAQVMSEAA